MPESAKEEVQTTALIKGILNGYPGNSAIFREYLQNSDDAKATEQIFILDETKYPKESLFDPVLEDTQGPALIAVNNGVLGEADWKALKSIHASSKTTDETQTGKNGLGFRASYHLTENPQVFSGEKLMILDAHHEFKDLPGGMAINVLTEGKDYADQLAPFKSVVKDVHQKYEGTAFRLPLRTAKQAERSKIKPGEATSVEEIRDLLLNFGSDELERTVLFLKNIKMIEIRHIKANGVEEFIRRVRVQDVAPSQDGLTIRRTTLESPNSTAPDRNWFFHQRVFDKAEATRLLSDRLKYNIGDDLTTEKLTPNIGIAYPLRGDSIEGFEGSLYTLLPLPIKTGFPMHLNATFALAPDRQSLKNHQEIGLPHSRERRLVEWNRLIFNEYSPKLWADLLAKITETLDPSAWWAAWPSQQYDNESYWTDLPRALVHEVIQRDIAVFPTIGASRFVSLSDDQVLIAPVKAPISLETLASLGLDIIQPPSHIHSLLQSVTPKPGASFLSPQRLYEVLVERYSRRSWSSPGNKDIFPDIMDYMVFSLPDPIYSRVTGLPWFYLSTNSNFIRLSSNTRESKYFVPTSEEEALLFANHPRMLSYSCMSSRLRNELLSTSTSNGLNIMPLGAADVLSYLRTNGIPDIRWVIRFWDWVDQWNNKNDFFDLLSRSGSLSLLPTASGTLRRVSDKMVSFEDTDQAIVGAWNRLGVYGPHDLLSNRVVSMLKEKSLIIPPRSPAYVPLLLQPCKDTLLSTLIPTPSFRDSIYNGLPSLGNVSPLTTAQKSILESLPIFSVRDAISGRSTLQRVSGSRIHINLPPDFPLPIRKRPWVYVDISDYKTKELLQLLEQVVPNDIFDILTLAVDHWSDQKPDQQAKFVEQIIHNWYRAPVNLKAKLKGLPFVTVNGIDRRVPPQGLISPKSSLTVLYDGETAKVPAGRFEADEYISVMQSAGFFSSSLTDDIVAERLSYLSSAPFNPVTIEKSSHLLKQLDRNWKDAFGDTVRHHRSSNWLPGHASLLTPEASRDNHIGEDANPYFYDKVLTILPSGSASTPGLRSALGWSDIVPSGILVDQLCYTLELPHTRERVDRLAYLIEYLSILFSRRRLSPLDMNDLRASVHNQSWVPISYSDTVSSRYALLQDSALKAPFHPARQCDTWSMEFLQELGCRPRPTTEILLEELEKYKIPDSSSDIDFVVSVLHEIAQHHPDVDRSQLLVLGQDICGHPFHDVYFPDLDQFYIPESLKDKTPIHHAISRTLADSLGIESLSALIFQLRLGDVDDFNDEEQMSEDLTERIRGFLREYDVSYAFNEFLANADDASASQFSIRIEAPPLPGSVREKLQVISPEFHLLYDCHSLILHNNATMSEEDFKGLRQVGMGGKRDRMETHGRHGLGALSLYYFTDVAIIISGESVMILDPSGRHLPRAQGGGKRTAFKGTLREIGSRYPDQLYPYDGVFGFSVKSSKYQGTLFCLPLSSTIQDGKKSICERPCSLTRTSTYMDMAYRDLARNAFYFTKLEHISAWDGTRNIWEMSATRDPVRQLQNTALTCAEVHVQVKAPYLGITTEDWMVATCGVSIPSTHTSTAASLKLNPGSEIKVQLAIQLSSNAMSAERHSTTADGGAVRGHYLFSTLRLPKTTSLPFHLNARFCISSNRQSIAFAPPDSSGSRDAKSSFNEWVLNTVVPPLYLASLEYLIQDTSNRGMFFRDIWWLVSSPDEISKAVSLGFMRDLSTSDARLFETREGSLFSFRESIFSRDEPREVDKLLKIISTPRIVTALRHSLLLAPDHLQTLKSVDPAFVKDALLRAEPASVARLQERSLNGRLVLEEEIAATLAYVREAPPFAALPLAVLASGELVPIPGPDDPPIYFADESHISLFPTARFLRSREPETIQALLADTNSHIIELSQDRVVPLFMKELDILPDDQSRKRLLSKFWCAYPTLPGPPALSVLEELDYKIVCGTSRTLSIQECKPGHVLLLKGSSDPAWILSVAEKLEIEVVDVGDNEALREFLSTRFSDDMFTSLLKCMDTKKISLENSGLTATERSSFRKELHSQLRHWWQDDPGIDKSYLGGLHIWKSWSTTGELVSTAWSLRDRVLPSFVSLKSIKKYLRLGCAVAEYSPPLTEFLAYTFSEHWNTAPTLVMSPSHILKQVRLPSQVSAPQELNVFSNFLESMLRFGVDQLGSCKLLLPDTAGDLRPFNELYDHTIPLFSATLTFHDNPAFMHWTLRDTPTLSIGTARRLGLRDEISVTNFLVCAQAVERAFEICTESRNANLNQVFEMAKITFDHYRTVLPPRIMTNGREWDSVDGVAFVRRDRSRRRGASYVAERYCKTELPLILPPSKFVLSDYEPIAWTQRAVFPEAAEPAEQILAVHKTLGVPEVGEVVRHLKILATEVSRDHPNDRTLILDLKATYKWLNDHAEQAKKHLIPLAHEALFLNVVNPVADTWDGQWTAAKDLVLNLHYDIGSKRRIHDFLQNHGALLQAAGSRTLTLFERVDRELMVDGAPNLRDEFDKMRKQELYLDVVFVRASPETEDFRIPAHRAFVAATIPHFREMTSEGLDAQNAEFEFAGTEFGAKAVLDFVYTGDFQIAPPEDNAEAYMVLLRDLLELLPVAQQWGMDEMKARIEWYIIHEYGMIQRLPDSEAFDMMLQEAITHDAESLKKALEEFKGNNSDLIG